MNDSIEKIIQQHNIILFDAVCVLCNGWVNFLLKYDQECTFKITAVQSPLGQEILKYYGMPLDHYETMLTVYKGQCYTKSTAFLKVMQHLRFPFSFVAIGLVVPSIIRDFFYKIIAHNRYQLFGKTNQCTIPSTRNKQHFLEVSMHDD